MHTYVYRSRKGTPPLSRLTARERTDLVAPIGATEIVRQRLSELFPDVVWTRIADVWWAAHADRTPYIDILLAEDPGGTCKFIVLDKADDATIRSVMRHFDLNVACLAESGGLMEA